MYLTPLPKKGFHHFTSLLLCAFWCLMVLVEGGRVALVTSQVVLELCEEESCKLVALSAAHSGTVTTQSLQAAEPAHCSCCTVPRICLLKL